MEHMTRTEYGVARKYYSYTHRFIDDLCAINNSEHFDEHWIEVYPEQLQLNKENEENTEATFLDLRLKIENRKIISSLYDKRDNFPFEIVSYPDLRGNIASNTGYAVYMSQLLRIARNCTMIQDAVDRIHILTGKLLGKGYLVGKLKKAAMKCLNRNIWICEKYNIGKEQLINMFFRRIPR